jgi:ABC-2 type transport system ATP-binding protein
MGRAALDTTDIECKSSPPRGDSIVVERLTKTFPISHGVATWLRHGGHPPRFLAVEDVGFSVRSGELFGLVGENGAGKSTILQILSGLTTPDTGSVVVNGVDGSRNPIALRKEIGLCSADERSFYFRLTARQNLEFFGHLHGLRGTALRTRVDAVTAMVDLTASLERRYAEFSSGMRQRLAIARAMLGDARVLLLDEPTRAVDPVHAAAIRSFVRTLATEHGKTVFLCTNLLEEAWEICDRIAIIRSGRIVTVATPDELIARSRRRRYAIVFDNADDALLARARSVPGISEISLAPHRAGTRMQVELDDEPRTLTELLHAVSSNGVCVSRVEPDTVTPLEIFTGLATGADDVR